MKWTRPTLAPLEWMGISDINTRKSRGAAHVAVRDFFGHAHSYRFFRQLGNVLHAADTALGADQMEADTMNHAEPALSAADPIELLHLALDAMDHGQGLQAMTFLKRLLMIKPGSAEAHYLLGTQQAKAGMTGRAIASLRTALAFEPGLDAARLRLGMLLASSGQLDDARTVWQAFDKLHVDDPFFLFKTGLLLIAEGDHIQGIAALRRGISLSHINTPLNEDMGSIIEALELRGCLPLPEIA